jgi:hypothetical protein
MMGNYLMGVPLVGGTEQSREMSGWVVVSCETEEGDGDGDGCLVWSSGMDTRQLDVLGQWTELTDRSPLIASRLVGLVVALSVAPMVVVMGRLGQRDELVDCHVCVISCACSAVEDRCWMISSRRTGTERQRELLKAVASTTRR